MNRFLISVFWVSVSLLFSLIGSPGLAKLTKVENRDDILFLTTKPTDEYYRYQRSIYEKLKYRADHRQGKPVDLRCAKENFGVFFEFVDPQSSTIEKDGKDGKGDSVVYKAWTLKERNRIKSVLVPILANYPGFVLSASPGERLKLSRIEKYERKYSHYYSLEALAAADCWSPVVYVTDLSKPGSDKRKILKETLIHELAHLVDYGDKYSLSREWINLVGKKLNATYDAWDRNDCHEVSKICQKKKLPGYYSSFNLQECFAECLMNYFTKDLKEKKIAHLLEIKMIARILSPSDEECLWKIRYSNGVRAHNLGEYDRAEKLFAQAMKIHSNVPCLLNYRARNYHYQNKYSKGLRLSKKAVNYLLKNELSSNDSDVNNLKICYAYHLRSNNKYRLAIPIYDDLIENHGEDLYHARAVCYENLGNYYDAASDYMKGKIPITEPCYLTYDSVSQDEFEKSLKRYNENVSKYPYSTNYRRKRAVFLSKFVFAEYDCEREKLFRMALDDFKNVLKVSPYKVANYQSYLNHLKQVEFDCVRLCCHNNKLDLAAEHCKNILEIEPENHKALAIIIGAYSRLGERNNTRYYCKLLENQIMAKQLTKNRLDRCYHLRCINLRQLNCDEKPVLNLILKDLRLALQSYKSKGKNSWQYKSSACLRVESFCAKICFRLKEYKQAIKHCENLILDDSDMYDKIAHVVKIGSLERLGEKKKTFTAFKTFKKEYKFFIEK